MRQEVEELCHKCSPLHQKLKKEKERLGTRNPGRLRLVSPKVGQVKTFREVTRAGWWIDIGRHQIAEAWQARYLDGGLGSRMSVSPSALYLEPPYKVFPAVISLKRLDAFVGHF